MTRKFFHLISFLLLFLCASCAQLSHAGPQRSVRLGYVGTVVSLDPAAGYDPSSLLVNQQIYGTLLGQESAFSAPRDELTSFHGFTGPHTFEVDLKPDLRFANGHELSGSDVRFSINRIRKIAHPRGPSALFYNLKDIELLGKNRIIFHLFPQYDASFADVLASSAAHIVDEEVFDRNKILKDTEIIAKQPFAGPLRIYQGDKLSQFSFVKNSVYQGHEKTRGTDFFQLQFFRDVAQLRTAFSENKIDVQLAGFDDSEKQFDKRPIPDGIENRVKTGTLYSLVFESQQASSFSSAGGVLSEKKYLTVRRAIADVVDRKSPFLSKWLPWFSDVYSVLSRDTLYSNDTFFASYGDSHGKPDAARAQKRLKDIAVPSPISVRLGYLVTSRDPMERTLAQSLKFDLEKSGLFSVTLVAISADDSTKCQEEHCPFDAYIEVWHPDFLTADNYLTPVYLPRSVPGGRAPDSKLSELILRQSREQNIEKRKSFLTDIQQHMTDVVSAIPLVEESKIVLSHSRILPFDFSQWGTATLKMNRLSFRQ